MGYNNIYISHLYEYLPIIYPNFSVVNTSEHVAFTHIRCDFLRGKSFSGSS